MPSPISLAFMTQQSIFGTNLNLSRGVMKNYELFRQQKGFESDDEAILWLLQAQKSNSISLLDALPTEVLVHIVSYLDSATIRLCSYINSDLRYIIYNDDLLKFLVKAEWTGLYVMGGIRPRDDNSPVQSTLKDLICFNPTYKRWINMPDMTEERYHCAAVSLNRQLYVLGGRNSKCRLNSAERYDLLTRKWETLPSMKAVRSAPAVAAFHGCIYVFGGYDGKSEHRTIEKFNPISNEWISHSTWMPIEACEVSAVVFRNDIYIIGGTQSRYSKKENVLDTCQRYSPQTDTWQVMSPMPSKRMCPAATVLNNRIYVIGGSNGTASLDVVEVFNPRTNSWTTAPSMNICRSNATASVFDGEIYVAGGFCSGALDSVEKYNPLLDRWYMVARMPERRDACKVVAFE